VAIRRWVAEACAKMPRIDVPVAALLACTHYGYRKEQFAAAFEEARLHATVVDPNESAAADLFRGGRGEHHDVEVQVVSRYAIPRTTIDALTFFLDDVSPRTVAAVKTFVHQPDLF
jgi:hypothetical protein